MDELMKKLLASLSAAKSKDAQKNILLGIGQLMNGGKVNKAMSAESQELLNNMVAMIEQIRQMEAASDMEPTEDMNGEPVEESAKSEEGANASDSAEDRKDENTEITDAALADVGKSIGNQVQLAIMQQLSNVAKSVQAIANTQKSHSEAITNLIGGDNAMKELEQIVNTQPKQMQKSGDTPVGSQNDQLVKLLSEIKDGINGQSGAMKSQQETKEYSGRDLLSVKSKSGGSLLGYMLDPELYNRLPSVGRN